MACSPTPSSQKVAVSIPRAGAAVCTLHVLPLSLRPFVSLGSLASLHSPTTTCTLDYWQLSPSSNGCLSPWGPKIKWHLVQIGAAFAPRQLEEAPVASWPLMLDEIRWSKLNEWMEFSSRLDQNKFLVCFPALFLSSDIRIQQRNVTAAQWVCSFHLFVIVFTWLCPLNPSGRLMTASCHALVSELYASNYDNVSRPCSTAAAGLQPETGYQPAGQCCQLSISWGGTTGMLSSVCPDVMWNTVLV